MRFLAVVVMFFLVAIFAYAAYDAYDIKSVALHNSSDSCWVIINKGVYDVTNISDRFDCGKDNTKLYFSTRPPYIEPMNDYLMGYIESRAYAIVTLTIEEARLPQYSGEQVKEYYSNQNFEFQKKVLGWMASLLHIDLQYVLDRI
jgi:hypothetical protein